MNNLVLGPTAILIEQVFDNLLLFLKLNINRLDTEYRALLRSTQTPFCKNH